MAVNSRVYIVQRPVRRSPSGLLEPVHDLSSAIMYGEPVELLSPSAQPFTPDGICEELWEKLSYYGDSDWLLCLGSPILIGWATAIAAQVNDGKVNMLQWHKRGEYIPVKALLWQYDEAQSD